MTAVLLALLAAAAYGSSDFAGGIAAARLAPWTVSMISNTVGGLTCLIASIWVGGTLTGADLGWSLLAGVGNMVGTSALYRGMNAGRMGVVAPVSGVGAAVLPALVGILGGERPGTVVWVGLVLALPAIWLVASEPATLEPSPAQRSGLAAGVVDGLVAGCGFGVLLLGLAQTSDGARLLPLATNQLTAAALVAALGTVLRIPWRPRRERAPLAALAGLLGTAATGSFLAATKHGYLTVTAVITSLYPATTVLLAAVVLRERVHRPQAVGLALCAVAVALVAAG
ncbi:EamA family transporter [Nocardioides cheoyonin]|uniref:EamA family transporter n=1 Tax=Nocardioides cheoyonin TaxID=3156615 RepID=UPI0032B32314